MSKKIISTLFTAVILTIVMGGSAQGITGSVHLTYPNGEQCYRPGDTVNIYWEKSGDIDHVALYFSPNGYGTRPTQYFYMSSVGQLNYYAWTVPTTLTTQGVIWVVAHTLNHSEGVADTNDLYFRIATNCDFTSATPEPTPIPTITPLVPTGLSYEITSSNYIRLNWNASGGATSYKINRIPAWEDNQSWRYYSSLSATDTNVVSGMTYRYTVTAITNVNGYEYYSAQSIPIYVYLPPLNTTSPTPTPTTIFTPLPTVSASPTPLPSATPISTPTSTPSPTPIADSFFEVSALDNEGHTVAYAGVVLDTAMTNTTFGITTGFWKTDASGRIRIPVRNGTYIVRAFLPPERGYINPVEQSISISSGETKEIRTVFIKKETVFPIYIKGTTRLSDGRAIEAFVWAWSDKGRSASIRSNSDGSFNLQISPDDKWHIGAGRSMDEIPYKSTEITISVTNQTVSTELILSRLGDALTSGTTMTTKSSTETVTTQIEDGAKVIVPAYSAPTSTNITVEVKPTVEIPSQPSARVLGAAYDIKVRDQAGSYLSQFSNLIEVELPYDPSLLTSQSVTEGQLIPSYYDDATGTWVKITNYTIDKTRNVIIARVNHLTVFAIVLAAGSSPLTPPSSVLATALSNGQIRLTWTNPSGGWDHIKIYRSENPGSLGRLEGTVHTGFSFTNDIDIKDGVTYYYVVRAVDQVGSETSNITPVSVKAIGTSIKTSANTALKDGDMISAAGSNDPDIYIINGLGYKRLFLNPAIFAFYGHLGGFQNVKSTTSSIRDSYGTSGLFRNCETNDSKVYGVEITGEDSGILHWVNSTGEQAVADDPDFFKKVFCINNNEFNWYQKGSSYLSVNQIPDYSR
jgi:hypothetical protein